MSRINLLILILLILTATTAVYWQTTQFDFVNFDDDKYIYENPYVKTGLSLENITWAFKSFHSGNWHPVTWLSHMLDCQIYGTGNPGLHHLTNLLFHLANTLLLFLVFLKITESPWPCLFVSALFALHPLHVESVAWISERKDVLSAFFWLLTMLAYTWYTRAPSINRYLLVSMLFILGLMAKPMLVTLPVILLLVDFWPLQRVKSQFRQSLRLIGEKIPLFLIALLSSIITLSAQDAGGAVSSLDRFTLLVRLANALTAYAAYILKMIYPANLAVLYPHPGMPAWPKILSAIFLLAAITFISAKYIKKHPYLMVGWLWYLTTLLPVIGIIQVGRQAIADRYTYIPLIGLFIMIAFGLPALMASLRFKRKIIGAFSVVILLILAGLTWQQASHWQNSITLFDHALQVTSNNYVAHNNLGVAMKKHGNIEKATQHYIKALRIEPNYVEARNNLGTVLMAQGQYENALMHFSKALQLQPKNAIMHLNMGLALNNTGQTEKALRHFSQAVNLNPGLADAHFYLANALNRQNRFTQAINHYAKAIELKPDFAKAFNNMGIALIRKGDISKAIDYFKMAIVKDPNYANARKNLKKALTLLKKNQ